MRLVRDLVAALLGLGLAGALGIAYDAFAQAPQTPQPTCEQRLDEAQNQLIQLRKLKAQSDFQAASVEEAALSLKRQLEQEQAKSRAAEKK